MNAKLQTYLIRTSKWSCVTLGGAGEWQIRLGWNLSRGAINSC
jgi:hypothetical protein